MVDCPSDTDTSSASEAQYWVLWDVYFTLLCVAACSQFANAIAVAIWTLRSWRRKTNLTDISDPIAVLIPCYLPNEAAIIKDTINHVLHKFTHVRQMHVHLVYNTPYDMDIEKELQSEEVNLPDGAWRKLSVHKVKHSTSKAQNLNYIIPEIKNTFKYTAIYDADHHPDPESLAMAVLHAQRFNVSCVQGSTYIRKGNAILRTVVHGEFFFTYFMALPAMEVLTGTGFFGGSNGIWETSKLKLMNFDESALTEDVDCFARAALSTDLTFTFLPQCKSGELVPGSIRAFWKQRLRWAMGWDQVTLRHAKSIIKSNLSWRKRCALLWILIGRWLLQFLVFVFLAYGVVSGFMGMFLVGFQCTPDYVASLQKFTSILFVYCLIMALVQICVHERSLHTCVAVLAYFVAMPLYCCLNFSLLTVSLIRNASGNLGKWVCTPRQVQDALGHVPSDPDLQRPAAKDAPLLPREDTIDGFAVCILGAACTITFAAVGSVIGGVVSRHTKEIPLWGWVPFGWGSTTVTLFSPRAIAAGAMVGGAIGAILYLAIVFAICARRTRDPLLRTMRKINKLCR